MNAFFGKELQECFMFPVPLKIIPYLKVYHHGPDAWTPEWIRIILDDDTFINCPDGQELDNSESHNDQCDKPERITIDIPVYGDHVVRV